MAKKERVEGGGTKEALDSSVEWPQHHLHPADTHLQENAQHRQPIRLVFGHAQVGVLL